jgi:hypothetical protein
MSGPISDEDIKRHPVFIETQKQMEEAGDTPPAVFMLKLILSVAVDKEASRVVLGRLENDDCERIQHWADPEEGEDGPSHVQVWYRKGSVYEEATPAPAGFHNILPNVAKTWNGCDVPKRGSPVQVDFRPLPEDMLSRFRLQCLGGQFVDVVLKRAQGWHFELSAL